MSAEHPTGTLELLVWLLRRWFTISLFAFLGLGTGIAYALLSTRWYAATITVVPSQRSVESLAGLQLGQDALAIEVQRITSVLASASVRDAVIEKFALEAHYGTTHRQHTRAILGKRCTASVDKRSAVVALTCEDQSPELATQMAAFFGEEGNRVFKRISASAAREERKFLEKQVEQVRRDVDEASRRLREFQRTHKIIDLTEQSKAVISAMAAVKGEMLSKQLGLAYLATFSAGDESSVVQLKHQIGILKHKLGELEAARSAPAATSSAKKAAPPQSDFFPSALKVPDLRFELEELVREQKIQESLFFAMTQRYEMAKASEARDTSTFQILDHPVVPTLPARPNQRSLAVLGFGGGIAAALAWILLPLAWRNRHRRAA